MAGFSEEFYVNFKFCSVLLTSLILIIILLISLRDLLETNRQLQKSNRNLQQLSERVLVRKLNRKQGSQQCKICFYSFNGSDHRPAKINCNHVFFCEPCLTTIAGKGIGRCPICDDKFKKKDILPLYMSFAWFKIQNDWTLNILPQNLDKFDKLDDSKLDNYPVYSFYRIYPFFRLTLKFPSYLGYF